jgi:ATP-binding cassette subfamily F protein uup
MTLCDQRKAQSRRKIKLNLKSTWNAWEVIIELHKISEEIYDKVILDNFSFDFQRGERYRLLVKKNGTGNLRFGL